MNANATNPPDTTPWASKQSFFVRLIVALFATGACVIPVGGLAIFSMMMMAFMADAGLPNEDLAEAAVMVSMAGLGILGTSGFPIAAGLLSAKHMRPFILAMAGWIALGGLLYVGGFVAYYATLIH